MPKIEKIDQQCKKLKEIGLDEYVIKTFRSYLDKKKPQYKECLNLIISHLKPMNLNNKDLESLRSVMIEIGYKEYEIDLLSQAFSEGDKLTSIKYIFNHGLQLRKDLDEFQISDSKYNRVANKTYLNLTLTIGIVGLLFTIFTSMYPIEAIPFILEIIVVGLIFVSTAISYYFTYKIVKAYIKQKELKRGLL